MPKLRLLLSQAKQFRTCPPFRIRVDPENESRVKHHLQICPFCSTTDIEELEASDELMIGISNILFPSLLEGKKRQKAPEIKPGHICPVLSDLGKWREGYYYNPPLVLVLNILNTISDDILVAQTYHETALAAPGDLVLNDGQTGAGEMFVQPWNSYTLKASFLSAPVGTVSEEIIETVLKMSEGSEETPDWAPKAPPMEENDPRLFFREIEVEVAYTFSCQAVGALLGEMDAAGEVLPPVEDLVKDLKHLVPDAYFEVTPETPEEALCFARHPEESLTSYASSDEIQYFTVNYAVIGEAGLEDFTPLKAEIHPVQIFPDEIAYSGNVLDLPGPLSGSRLLCYLKTTEGGMIKPDVIHWDETDGFFLVKFSFSEKFPQADEFPEIPMITIIAEKNEHQTFD